METREEKDLKWGIKHRSAGQLFYINSVLQEKSHENPEGINKPVIPRLVL